MADIFGYIYLTTNLINNKKYIGQHHANRFTEGYKGSGKLILRAIRKYGPENFRVELLEYCYSQEELDTKEEFYIMKYKALESDQFYNLAHGGSSGSLILARDKARSPDIRAKAALKIMETRRAKYNGDASPWFHSKEVISKRVATRKERYGSAAISLHTPEAEEKAKISKISKYGSTTGFLMTKEIRDKVAYAESSTLEFDNLEFRGYKQLQSYILDKYNDTISLSSLRRLSYGCNVLKYKDYWNKIKIVEHGSVMKNRVNSKL